MTEQKECCLCEKLIDIQYAPSGEAAWHDGHSAQPLADGRCCSTCNLTKVIPRRIDDSFKRP